MIVSLRNIPFLLTAFLGGILFSSFVYIPENVIFAILGVSLGAGIVVFFSKKARTASFVILIVCFFFLGMFRLSLSEQGAAVDQLSRHYGERIMLRGVVLKTERKPNSLRTMVETNLGKVLLITGPYPQYRYGDLVEVSGIVSEPEAYGSYDTKKVLAKDRIYSQMIFPDVLLRGFDPPSKIKNALFSLRNRFEENLKNILPEPHVSLADGMLLGNEGVLAQDIKDAFRKSGTIHILVLSGYNITIVGAFVMALFGYFFPATIAWTGSVLGIIAFTLMTGAEAPAVRAAIMAILGLVAFRSGRNYLAILGLLWAAFFMAMYNPMVVRWDRGFQLSFLATLGLIVAGPLFGKKLLWLPKQLGIREGVATTLSAQIFVLPLLLSWGSEISILSPLANVFIVGVVPTIMLFGFLGGMAGFVSTVLGKALASVAYFLISFQIVAAKFFSSVVPALTLNSLPLLLLILIYLILGAWAMRFFYIKTS